MKWEAVLIILAISVLMLMVVPFKVNVPLLGNFILKPCPHECCGTGFDIYDVKNCTWGYVCSNYSCIETDTDNDGLKDLEERELGTDPYSTDSDGDALTDFDETRTYGTNPINPNSDCDRYLDGQEIRNGLNPKKPNTAAIEVSVSNEMGEYHTFNLMKDAAIIGILGVALSACTMETFGLCAKGAPVVAAAISAVLEDPIYSTYVDVNISNMGDDYTSFVSYDVAYFADNKEIKREKITKGRLESFLMFREKYRHDIKMKEIPVSIWNFITKKNKITVKIENIEYEKFPVFC